MARWAAGRRCGGGGLRTPAPALPPSLRPSLHSVLMGGMHVDLMWTLRGDVGVLTNNLI